MHSKLLLLSSRLHAGSVRSVLKGFSCEVDTRMPEHMEQVCQYDIVLMDVNDAADCSRIGAMKKTCSSLLVLALTPFGDEAADQRAVNAGADDVLCLPATTLRFRLTLHNLLRLRVLERVMAASKRVAA